jgi:hypothetical protein
MQRETYRNLTLVFYKKVSQIDHNKKYHKVRFIIKLKCNEHVALDCVIISPHRLMTPPTN